MGKFSVLEQSKLTNKWSIEERSALAHFMELQNLKKGEYLFFEKTKENKLYFLDEGSLQLEGCGTKVLLEAGSTLGELSLFRDSQKRISAMALSHCQFWVLTKENWKKLVEQAPDLAVKLKMSVYEKLSDLIDLGGLPPKLTSLQEAQESALS